MSLEAGTRLGSREVKRQIIVAAEKSAYCHPEVAAATEGSAFSPIRRKKQIPRANLALGMTLLESFRNLYC